MCACCGGAKKGSSKGQAEDLSEENSQQLDSRTRAQRERRGVHLGLPDCHQILRVYREDDEEPEVFASRREGI